MNKIILAYYINVGNCSMEEIEEIFHSFTRKAKSEEMIQYFFPIQEGPTRVECVYPKYVIGEDVDNEFKLVIKKLNEQIKKIDFNEKK